MLYIRVFAGGQRSSDVICFCNPKKKLRIFMSPDEHFESLNTVLNLEYKCPLIVRKWRGRYEETQRAIGAETTKKWKKNCEDKSAVVGRNQNQNGVVFFSSLEMQRKSLLCSWTLKVLDFYSTCKHSLTILCTF